MRHLLTCLICIAAIAAFSLATRADIDHSGIERTVEKTFTVQPGGILRVQADQGSVEVLTSKDPAVKVTVNERIDADSDAEADKVMGRLQLTMEQNGNDVTVTSKYDDEGMESFVFFRWRSSPRVRPHFTVTVPAHYRVDLKTSAGGISVADLDGTAKCRTRAGAIHLGHISGDVDAATSAGSVRLEEGDGAAKLFSRAGAISAGLIKGPAELNTSAGSVRLDEGDGTVKLDSRAGAVSAGLLKGPAELNTSMGSIRVEKAENTLQAFSRAGAVEATFSGALQGDCALETAMGSVRAYVDPAANFELNASTSMGSVETNGLTLSGDPMRIRRGDLSGTVGKGGPKLLLRSRAGGIAIETRKS